MAFYLGLTKVIRTAPCSDSLTEIGLELTLAANQNRDKKSECLCICEICEDKVSSNQVHTIQAQKKLLTSFVGGTLGSTVGLDDGCSEDREQEISCVSKCDKVSHKVKKYQEIDFNSTALFFTQT